MTVLRTRRDYGEPPSRPRELHGGGRFVRITREPEIGHALDLARSLCKSDEEAKVLVARLDRLRRGADRDAERAARSLTARLARTGGEIAVIQRVEGRPIDAGLVLEVTGGISDASRTGGRSRIRDIFRWIQESLRGGLREWLVARRRRRCRARRL
jgi:hypothetical protein